MLIDKTAVCLVGADYKAARTQSERQSRIRLVRAAEDRLVAIPHDCRVLTVVPDVPQPIPSSFAVAVKDRDVPALLIGIVHRVQE
jgi:hypothetical protein